MNQLFKLTCLILTLTLNFSCVEKKAFQAETSPSRFVNTSKGDTLKFTSGIRSIFQDSKGNYWFGSHQEGASYYDGKSFQYFTQVEGLAGNQVRSIQEDSDGNIWFGTANGVSSYNGNSFTNYTTKNYRPNLGFEDAEHYLWFNAGINPGINQFDGKHLSYLPFPTPKDKKLNSYGVTDVSKGKDGKVWIATYAAIFNFYGRTISLFDKSKLALKEGENLHIRSVYADSKGRIWIGNNGLGVLLLEGSSAMNFSDKNGLIHANSSKNGNHSPAGTLEHVFAIEEDSEGNIWFGDRDTGPWKFDNKTMTNYSVDKQLVSPMVWCIYRDNKNNLLFGMAGGGVYKFNGKSFDRMF